MDQKAGNLHNNARALDVLEKHISQQNKRAKTNNYGALSSMWQTISESSRLVASPNKAHLRTNEISLPRKVDKSISMGYVASLDTSETPHLRSSPLRKSVAFSDKLESSPPAELLDSSPRHSPYARPSKPILKLSSSPVRMKVSPRRSRPGSKRALSEHFDLDTTENKEFNPLSIDFWVCGEVHSLYNINSVTEFKAILTGGLYFLSSATPAAQKRFFEFYATFNNIVPVYTSQNDSEVKDKKNSIIIKNIDLILSTAIPHLTEYQSTLLKAHRKDPFVSRTYVQIVRFLTTLFSNFKLIKACDGNKRFLTSLQKVVQCCIETMRHPYSNKVMITAQLAFLRDEQCGLQRMTAPNVSAVIEAMTQMKRIDSTNLVCEKLLLLKHFLAKYTDIMLETVYMWLPSEVLSRLLVDGYLYSSKITSSCISILLDLLKKCLTDSTHHNVLAVLKQPVRDLPFDSEDKSSKSSTVANTDSIVAQRLLDRVEFLITEKDEPKLAFDLWLAAVGLLFNSDTELVDLCSDPVDQWLELNLKYQNAGVEGVSGLALRSWRIVTYVIGTKSLPASTNGDAGHLTMLLEPFTCMRNARDTDYEEACFILRGILYLALCNHKPNVFSYNFRNIIIPFLSEQFDSCPLELRTYALDILNFLFQPQKSKKGHQKDFNPLKVVASQGVQVDDFLPFSSQIYGLHWHMLFEMALKLQTGSDTSMRESSFEFLTLTIKNVPPSLVSHEVMNFSMNALSEALLCSLSNVRRRVIQALTCCIIGFHSNLWTFSEKNSRLEAAVRKVVKDSSLSYLEILKAVTETTKNFVPDVQVYNYFMRFDDSPVESYISNYVCSKIRSAEMSQDTFIALLSIADKISSRDIAKSVMDSCNKVIRDSGNDEHHLMVSCDIATLSKYLRLRLSLQEHPIHPKFASQFGLTIKKHNQVKFCLHKILDHRYYSTLVLQAIIFESSETTVISRDSLEAWVPVISKFPMDEFQAVLEHFDLLALDFELSFLLRALKCEASEDMKISTQIMESLKFSDSGRHKLTAHSQNLQLQVLNDCCTNGYVKLLNKALRKFMTLETVSSLMKHWCEDSGQYSSEIDAETLVLLIDCMEQGGDLLNALKARLRTESCNFGLSAIEAALKFKKHNIITECKEEITHLLLDCRGQLKNNENRAMDALRETLTLLTAPGNESLDAVLQELYLTLPAKKGTLAYEQLSIVCSAENLESKELKIIRERLAAGSFDLSLESVDVSGTKAKCSRQYRFKAIPTKPPVRTLRAREAASERETPNQDNFSETIVTPKANCDVGNENGSVTEQKTKRRNFQEIIKAESQSPLVKLDERNSHIKTTRSLHQDHEPRLGKTDHLSRLLSAVDTTSDVAQVERHNATNYTSATDAKEPVGRENLGKNQCMSADQQDDGLTSTSQMLTMKYREAEGCSNLDGTGASLTTSAAESPSTRFAVESGFAPPDECTLRKTKSCCVSQSKMRSLEAKVEGALPVQVDNEKHKEEFPGELKLPIFNSGKAKEASVVYRPVPENPQAALKFQNKNSTAADTGDGNRSNPYEVYDAENNKFSVLDSRSGLDRQTRMIIKIIKQFGKNEFSQLTEAQKTYLRNAVVKFVAKLDVNPSDEHKINEEI
ncbi:LAME_0H04148g1_1 [Lachancea meyersii CBS 8951]|uniref:LAME_0H04148g1_1 n=1 Tax=Lachancea meyersii CBS 8951 TaxID=1266667 RepID=A0A1G4KDX7_9SACH|nr:LAME_0H04148g1_1 [Lachancea meyersii CBS 8951]